MYKEYPTFYYYDTREYGRKSRTHRVIIDTDGYTAIHFEVKKKRPCRSD